MINHQRGFFNEEDAAEEDTAVANDDHLEEEEPQVTADGAVKVKGTDKQLLWHEVCLGAYTAHNLPPDLEPGLKEGAFYDPVNFTFPAGAYICEVEVDPATGKSALDTIREKYYQVKD